MGLADDVGPPEGLAHTVTIFWKPFFSSYWKFNQARGIDCSLMRAANFTTEFIVAFGSINFCWCTFSNVGSFFPKAVFLILMKKAYGLKYSNTNFSSRN